MENHKRAFRRWKQHVNFLRRLNDWIKPGHTLYLSEPGTDNRFFYRSKADTIKMALKGKCYTFLKTTGRPCNCNMCTYEKYERPLKSNLNKQIWRDIQDDMPS